MFNSPSAVSTNFELFVQFLTFSHGTVIYLRAQVNKRKLLKETNFFQKKKKKKITMRNIMMKHFDKNFKT